uniref:Uncharacterized protein n=1 Tax=Lygus hesperus TaxID=30085 RepID=A0A146L3F7_LYGHE
MDQWKSYRLKVIYNRHMLQEEDIFREFSTYKGKSTRVGEMWQPNNCYNWTPPNPDIRAITQESPEIDPSYLEKFRLELRKMLEEEKRLTFFRPINDVYAGNRDNSRVAKEGPQWNLKPERPSKKRGVGRIAFIPRE